MTTTTKRALGALLAVVCSAIVFVYAILYTPVTTSENLFYLRPGLTKQAIISELHTQGLVRSPLIFNLYASLNGQGIKTGEYQFPKGSTPISIWRQLTSGTGFYFRPFIIIPGWTFKQLRLSLDQNPWLKHTLHQLNDGEIMKLFGNPGVSPEGLFYPETYFFTRGDSDQHILQRAYQFMLIKLNEEYAKRAEQLPYHRAIDALIVASLIEKEGRLDNERPLIASVIMNRLNKNMLLQIDATVIYALGDQYSGTIYKNDLKIDSAYNTYKYKGLPPAPIAMPGLPSILAALHPAQTAYYYYVAKADGSHQFSETLDDHHKAIQSIRLGSDPK